MLGLILGVAGVTAQSGPVAEEHPVYPFLRHQAALGNIPQNWEGQLPLTWGEVQRLLDQLAAHGSQLTGIDQQILTRFQVEFRLIQNQVRLVALWQAQTRDNFMNSLVSTSLDSASYPHGFYFTDSLATVWADWREYFKIQGQNKHRRGFYQDQLTFRGLLGKHLSFFWDYIQYRLPLSDSYSELPPEYKQGTTVTSKALNWLVWDLGQSGIYVNYPYWGFSLAKQPVYWGFSPVLSPILNTRVLPYTYLKINAQYKVFHFTSILGSLFPVRPTEKNKILPDKRIAAQRLAVDFRRNLTLAFNEMIIYSRRPIEPAYLVPVDFYFSEEKTAGDRDNLLMAFDGIWRPWKGIQIYGTFLWDELIWAHLADSFWANKFASQIGINWALKNRFYPIDFNFEFSQVRPWTYTHDDSLDTYTTGHIGLGFPYGPNSKVISISANAWLRSNLDLKLNWLWLRKGSGPGSDPNDNYGDRNQEFDFMTTALMGKISSTQTLTGTVRYRFNSVIDFRSKFTFPTKGNLPTYTEIGVTLDW